MGQIRAHRPFCPIPRKNEVLIYRITGDLDRAKGNGCGESASFALGTKERAPGRWWDGVPCLEACTSRKDNRPDSFPLGPLGPEGGRAEPWEGLPWAVGLGSPTLCFVTLKTLPVLPARSVQTRRPGQPDRPCRTLMRVTDRWGAGREGKGVGRRRGKLLVPPPRGCGGTAPDLRTARHHPGELPLPPRLRPGPLGRSRET